MNNMTLYLENKLIDALFRGVPYSIPDTLYIGLWTATLDKSSTGSTPGEVSGGSYARHAVVSSTSNWSATDGSTSTANPSSGSSGTTYNIADILFPMPTSSWGLVIYVGVLDAATAGNMLWWGALERSLTINGGEQSRIGQSNISFRINGT